MDIPIAQLLRCGHDPESVIIVAEKHGYYRLRCPECEAESRKREAPEWLWKALADDGEKEGGKRDNDATTCSYSSLPPLTYV